MRHSGLRQILFGGFSRHGTFDEYSTGGRTGPTWILSSGGEQHKLTCCMLLSLSILPTDFRPPNLCDGRRIHHGQYLHASVLDHMRDYAEYTPAAHLPPGMSWENIRVKGEAPHAGMQGEVSKIMTNGAEKYYKRAPNDSEETSDGAAGKKEGCASRNTGLGPASGGIRLIFLRTSTCRRSTEHGE